MFQNSLAEGTVKNGPQTTSSYLVSLKVACKAKRSVLRRTFLVTRESWLPLKDGCAATFGSHAAHVFAILGEAMRVLFLITFLALAGVVWASLAAARHIRGTRGLRRRQGSEDPAKLFSTTPPSTTSSLRSQPTPSNR